MSPYDADGFWIDAPEEFGFPPQILAQVPDVGLLPSEISAYIPDWYPDDAWSYLSEAVDVAEVAATGLYEAAGRVIGAGMRDECLSVRLPGIPGGEYLASAADWWAGQAVEYFGAAPKALGNVNDCINATIQQTLGIPGAGKCAPDERPRATGGMAPGPDGFLVKVPNWQDIFQFNNDAAFSDQSKQQRAIDYQEQLARSPTPPNLQEVGALLTALDDVQDEAATLAIVLMIAEKVAGRAIPGVGWVATAADALSIIYALSSAATGSGLPGKRGKRRANGKLVQTRNGLAGTWDELRRSGKLKIGIGDILQGLQATDSMFGVGIQLGGIMGFLQDAFWGGVRGAEFEARGPLWDPLGFTEMGRAACYNSPTLDRIHPRAHFALSHSALRVWSKASRVMPYIDQFGEHALASTLTGLRLAEQTLGPWLRSGVWVDPLLRAIELTPFVGGGVEAHGTKGLRPDEWIGRTTPAAMVGLTKAIGNVEDKGRQAFYESLVASTSWGLWADLEPGSKVINRQLRGHGKDAFTLLDAGMIPRFDLGD